MRIQISWLFYQKCDFAPLGPFSHAEQVTIIIMSLGVQNQYCVQLAAPHCISINNLFQPPVAPCYNKHKADLRCIRRSACSNKQKHNTSAYSQMIVDSYNQLCQHDQSEIVLIAWLLSMQYNLIYIWGYLSMCLA